MGVLALPPTAIRSVNAGLIVGNPVGSSNTRAKALTSAELKAIIEASGISYLPLAGGTLTGALSLGANALTCGAINASGNVAFSNSPLITSASNIIIDPAIYLNGTTLGASRAAVVNGFIVGSGMSYRFSSTTGANGTADLELWRNAANHLRQRRGLNPQTFDLTGTYTSDTSFESLCLKATASAHQIGSAIGSAGGTNRPIQLGHFNTAGAFTSGLSVAIDGQVTIASNLLFAGAVFRSDANTGMQCSAAGNITLQISGTQILGSGNVNEVTVRQAALLGFSSSAANVTSSPDAGICRATGPAVVVVANSGLQVRNLANSADAAVTCSTIVASSDLTLTPSSSRTLSTNGQFSVEMTSNTAGNLVYRGSDGTTRRMALTFS